MKQKLYSSGERLAMFEDALDQWVGSFKTKVERDTAEVVAFLHGDYFQYGYSQDSFPKRHCNKRTVSRMYHQVKELAEKYTIYPLSLEDEHGDVSREVSRKYHRPLPIGA